MSSEDTNLTAGLIVVGGVFFVTLLGIRLAWEGKLNHGSGGDKRSLAVLREHR